MKTKRTLSILLICVMLVLSLAGCKKNNDVEDETPTEVLTPTPEPVTAKELLEQTGNELKTIFVKTTGTAEGADEYKISLPDGKMSATALFKMKFNLMSLAKFDVDMNMNGNLTVKNNLGEGDAHIDMSMVTSSTLTGEDKTDSDTSDAKFYIDNTNGNEITVYKNEDNSTWTKSTQSVKEVIDQYTSKLAAYNVDVEEEKPEDMFKNREQFTAERTKLTETADGYTITTAFTWTEFYEAFKDDMDKLATEVAGSVTSALPNSISAEDLVKDFYGNGRGNFEMTANYSTDKTLKDIRIKVDDFSLSAQIKLDEETSLPISFDISSLDFKITIDRDETVSVSIPEDVKANAVEAATGVEDNYNWDITPDPDNTTDDVNTDITGDDTYGDLEKVTFEENGIYYLIVGGQTISFPFPEDWTTYVYDYSLTVMPDFDTAATYSDSYVTIEENAISSDLTDMVEYYKANEGAADYTITFNGAAQPSYVLIPNNEDDSYQNILVLEYVPGAKYYLLISILDFTKTAEPLTLIEKFALTF